MLRYALVLPLLAAVTSAAEPPGRTQVKLNGQTFTLPEGFEIELVAGPPLTQRPVAVALDPEGRLFVTEASGTNDPVVKQVVDKPHTLLRLMDRDGDGKFDSGGLFADQLMLPQGVMWHQGSVFVGHPPVITKFTDADGDGKPEQRETWFDGKTLTGCANDLHGPYAGPDGWIYWTKGAFTRQEYTLPDGKKFSTRASHIFRARPDGSGVEPVMTGGMDNPVDVAFSPTGERFLTNTFFQHPAGGKRDGLIHAVYGGVYGKDHDPVHEHPWTGPDLMPVMTHLGAAAPCGLHRYESDQFGPAYTNNLFACSFNLHKVTRHVLLPEGATYRTQDEDFLVSDSLDFHPTDVIEDADGSLLVVDTGGWYKLCCPTSQLVKPDVLGAIYRIRKTGSHKVPDPRGLKLPWEKLGVEELAKRLDDARPTVRERAISTLADRKGEALPPLRAILQDPKASLLARLNAVWVVCRIDSREAREMIRLFLGDPQQRFRTPAADEPALLAALHAVSLWRDSSAVTEVGKYLQSPNRHVRRVAAEALGRIGSEPFAPALFQALADPGNDRVLDHALTYALLSADRGHDLIATGLKDPNPKVRRAALIALGQMKDGLTADTAVGLLADRDRSVREAAWWVAGRHPEWGDALARTFRQRLADQSLTATEREELAGYLARFARSEAVQRLLAEIIADRNSSLDARRTALKAATAAGVKQPPAAWYTATAQVLKEGRPDLAGEAIELARTLPAPKPPLAEFTAALAAAGRAPRLAPEVRYRALAAIPGGPGKLEPDLFAALTAAVHRDQPAVLRAAAAEVLAKASLTSEQLGALAGIMQTIGPMELDRLLEPFTRSTDERAGLALLASLKGAAVRTSLRIDMLRPRLAKYSPAVQKEAESLYAQLNADAAAQREKLQSLLAGLSGGDVRRGQVVFHSAKAACITCHAMGYLGGKVGPDLTRIGGIRSERDLLEAIAFPSASFVRSYEPVKVNLLDGRSFQGILKKDAPEEVILVISATEEVRLPRKDIEELTPGTVSVMPSGLDQQLTRQELADLIAFLRASK